MGELARMGVRADAVAAIRLRAPPLIRRLVGRPWTADMTPNYARLCFAYVGARALASGGVGLQDFTPQALQDEAVGALARRIFVEDDGGDDPAAFTPQTAEAVLHDGRVIAVRIDALPGSPDAPLSRAAHLAKFADALAYGRGVREEARAEALIAQVDRLEDASDAGVLARLTFAATLDQKALLDGS
jgi:2-methylcitrate dehydratase PrpD